MTGTVKYAKTSLIHKYLLDTYSVPGPELAPGNQTKIPPYTLIKEAVKESRSVMGNKRDQFALHKGIREGLREGSTAKKSIQIEERAHERP